MNSKTFSIAVFILLFVFSSSLCIADEKKDRHEHPDYKKILSDSNGLGFDPDNEIFYRINNIIMHQFYGKPSEKDLADSIVKELGTLSAAANQKNPLDGRSFEKPSEVFEAALSSDFGIKASIVKYACVCGLFKGTGDPYSAFLTPAEYSSMMESLQAVDFAGIGIYLEIDKDNDNMLTVIEPIENTPSWRAGIQAGDVITEIDGESTKGLDIDMCSSRLRGPRGTSVVLSIRRKGFSGLRKYKITRDIITAQTVSAKVLDSGVGYIRIRSFGRKTGSDFRKAFAAIEGEKNKGLIIDLRNNGGGYVNAAIAISGLFMKKGAPIMSIKNRDGKTAPKASELDIHYDIPVAILINKYSASASEITAGAFQDYGRARIIGDKSFGKGSIQNLLPLRDGSAFKVTVAHYCTPNGRDIDKKGIMPDEDIDMGSTKIGSPDDAQLKRAEDFLLGK